MPRSTVTTARSAAGVQRSENSWAERRCSRAGVPEAGSGGRWCEEEVEGGGAGERGSRVATAASLSGKKRKRDAEDGGSGSGGDGPQLKRRRRHSETTLVCVMALTLPPLQRLVDACRAVFDGSSVPPMAPAAVNYIRGLMGVIGPHDVGLWQEMQFFHTTNTAGRQDPPIITCKHILRCDRFTIAVFFLPRGTALPLHDHPGMAAFTKLLAGSARGEAYDWVRPRVSGWGSAMLAEKVMDQNVTAASGAWALFPDAGGNMHRFVAGEEAHCAFLDILVTPPPSAPKERQRCAYYNDTPCELCPCARRRSGLMEVQRRGLGLAWLREVRKPRDLRIVSLPYRGPEIF